jgi:hypothetical protein
MTRKLIVLWGAVCILLASPRMYTVAEPGEEGFANSRIRETSEGVKNQRVRHDRKPQSGPKEKGTFSYSGYLQQQGDWQFYYKVFGEGELEIHLTSIPYLSDYDLYLFDCNGVVLDSSINSFNQDEEIIRQVGTDLYWMGVYCYSGGDLGDPYYLSGTYVTPPTLPDLVLRSLTATDYYPTIGQEITISLTVKNVGDTTSWGCYTDLCLNCDTPPSTPFYGDYYWFTYSLAPGCTLQFSQVVQNNVPETWHMYALTDSWDDETEKNECNNLYGPVDVAWHERADLVVKDFCIATRTPETGDWVNIIVVIENRGGDTAYNFMTDLFYDESFAPTPPAIGDASFSTTYLAPGDTKAWSFYVEDWQEEQWSMYVLVDSRNTVLPEEHEDNNVWGPENVAWTLYTSPPSITREEIIENGWEYVQVDWQCPSQNASAPDSDYCVLPNNDSLWRSDFLVGFWYTGEAYEWGGWDRVDAYLDQMTQGQRAGVHEDNDWLPAYWYNPCWSTGIDCSGFVSRCWELGYKRSTRTLYEVAHEISYDSLKTGDALNDTTAARGRHVRLFLTRPASGRIRVMESRSWGIGDGTNGCDTLTYREQEDLIDYDYVAMRYNNVYDPPNNNPVIEVDHIHCRYPPDDCGSCIKLGQQVTLEISAYDPDGDPISYQWFCFPGRGSYFLPNGLDSITTMEGFVTYVAPTDPWYPDDDLYVFVWDNKGGCSWLRTVFTAYDPEYSCLCGDTQLDGRVNVSDALYIVNYLFKGDVPPPDPILRGDANNNCELEIGDALRIVNWLFQGGDPPECCWFPPESSP